MAKTMEQGRREAGNRAVVVSITYAISQKVIDPDRLEALQNDVVQCLIGILGPVYLHNMFPFERYMGVLKKYVRNRAHPEASIAKGYGTEEIIEFCVQFIEDLRPIGIPESRHEGRLRGKGTLGRKATTRKILCRDIFLVL
uniref:Transposon protein, putative, CACTA, En/Spm sub-class n=1 Tax=Oryza sativa subsp. japonica TaxID=39947 RepID=Q33AU5_ORYSJ|nr:transposon protein, putative, CACTA, En/Spm sub-class [Oryza sativa Japonica Group]